MLAPAPARAAEAPAEEGPIFRVETLRVPGRPVDALLYPPADAGRAVRDLVVAAVAGTPPEETRKVALFPPPARPGGERGVALLVTAPPDAFAFDVADVDPAPGPEIVFLASDRLRISNPRSGLVRDLPLDPPLGLPPRSRELSRLAAIGEWDGPGRLGALLPTPTGARLVPLGGGPARPLALPLLADFETRLGSPPPHDGAMSAVLVWPEWVRADDDGDGRLDLFALSRFGVTVHRLGPEGLPSSPSRILPLRPFTAADELRPRATALRLVVRDLDGDGRADLLVNRMAGTILESRTATEVYRNPGDGVRLPATPDAALRVENGLATIEAEDLDGDGRAELVQARLAFGVIQAVRLLTTRRAVVDVTIYTLTPPGVAGLEPSWSGSLSLALDFAQGRVAGLLPTARGDWNGDGRRDLLMGLDPETLAIRLGRGGEAGPGIEPHAVTQRAPAAGSAVVGDLDGDGLDDLVVVDPRDTSGAVHLLHNRGQLPGTAPSLRATEPPADAGPTTGPRP